MDQETTYIRNDTMEQNNSHQAGETPSTNRGVYEWLKFVVFFAAIFLITVLIIRVIGPIIFTEYVPPIMGLTEESSEVQIEDESTDPQEATPIEAEAESESETEDGSGSSGSSEDGAESAENIDASEEGVVDEESNPLPTEEETSNKVDEEESDTAENESPIPSVVYIVLPGDTLTSIAAANSVTVEQLLAANDLLNPNFLQPGQEILIPQ